MLLNSENKEANYYLALIYYNKNNYNKSLEYLESIKYNKEKYLDLYIKNIEKIDPNDLNLDKYKSELNKVKLLNNKIDIDKTTINLIPITEKLISPPIKINKNYLLHFNNNLTLYNNKLDKIYWKINIFQKIEVIEYYNNKIYIISSNQLIQIDLETGHQDWEIYFRGDNIPKIIISKNIFTLIRVNKNAYNLLKIDKTGKIINKLEVKGDYNFSIDKQGNIYLFQLEKNALNWEILNEQFESISSKKSLFSNENREIEEIKSGDDYIIIKRGSTFYKFFNDSKIILKKHEFSKILLIKNTNHKNLFKIDDKICILNISDLSCDTFKFNLKETEIINDNNIYSIDKKVLKKINIFKNQSINYEALNVKNDSIIRVFEKIN